MPLLDPLERRLGRFAPSHLTLYLIIGQVFVTLSAMLGLLDLHQFVLVPTLAVHGQPWRFVTFLFYPPPVNFGSMLSLFFLPFAWWVFYLMGTALEQYWGAFRYCLFILLGCALTIGAAFLAPNAPVTNLFVAGSVFFAFAWLNPDFELAVFFVIPVKIKWLALLYAAGDVYMLVVGSNSIRWQVLASVGNFLVFFGRDIVHTMRYRRRTMVVNAERRAAEARGPEPRHRCRVCGKTDLTNPELDFRYCSKCAGDECYCPDHIFNHEHVLAPAEEQPQ